MKATSVSDLLFPAVYRRKALALLLLTPGRQLHVRAIARLTGTATGTMAKELSQLSASGLLLKHKVGNQVLFSANVSHPVYTDLGGLLRKTVGLADVLIDALAGVANQIQVALVYGSVARAAEHAESDVDVLIIGDISFSDAATALYAPQESLRREINPKVYRVDEWRARVESQSTFVKDILSRPKIFLLGTQNDLDALTEPSQSGQLGQDRQP